MLRTLGREIRSERRGGWSVGGPSEQHRPDAEPYRPADALLPPGISRNRNGNLSCRKSALLGWAEQPAHRDVGKK